MITQFPQPKASLSLHLYNHTSSCSTKVDAGKVT